MNIHLQWAEPLMEAAASSHLENGKPHSFLADVKIRLIVLLDEIFAHLSSSYQLHRTLVVQRLIIRLANQEDANVYPLFQQNVLNAKNPLEDLSKDDGHALMSPALILAMNGLNQYQAGGPAACTSLACQFLVSKQTASSQMLADLILANDYKGDVFLETEECMQRFGLKLAENPWEFQKEWSASMQVSFERDEAVGIDAAVTSLLDAPNIGGAIFTANGITISMRKREHKIEFFDSHGDNTLTLAGNAAYIYAFADHQRQQITDFLAHRFLDIGFTPHIEIWPIASS